MEFMECLEFIDFIDSIPSNLLLLSTLLDFSKVLYQDKILLQVCLERFQIHFKLYPDLAVQLIAWKTTYHKKVQQHRAEQRMSSACVPSLLLVQWILLIRNSFLSVSTWCLFRQLSDKTCLEPKPCRRSSAIPRNYGQIWFHVWIFEKWHCNPGVL